ncbi:hypothetical protein LCGC14_0836830 [marine sediment metagenome]|uniref:Uncharacterized protein n=1 Tax=marine sediment metagenome TaxID=412755 RepID=A0A0F9PIY7_9ZZZZ
MNPDFEDNRTTPKHIRIEREGEPKGLRRGPTKKKNRRKGPKARMDEIIAAKNEVKRVYGWIQDDKERTWATSLWGNGMRGSYVKWHAAYVQKLRKLLKKALKDNIITEEGAKYVQKGICTL